MSGNRFLIPAVAAWMIVLLTAHAGALGEKHNPAFNRQKQAGSRPAAKDVEVVYDFLLYLHPKHVKIHFIGIL